LTVDSVCQPHCPPFTPRQAMRVSAKAEYACLAMLELAANYPEPQPVRVKAIAGAHRLPQRFLAQILLQLKAAGLVASTRGTTGGYRLVRPPDEISLAAVIGAIDHDPPARSALRDLPQSAEVRALRAAWQEVQEAEERILDQVTLAEVIRRTQDAGTLSYQI